MTLRSEQTSQTALTDLSDTDPTLSRRRRKLILGIASMGFILGGLDSTALNIALPNIQNTTGASVSELQWVVNAYTLVMASLLMLAGSMADRFGRRKVFQLGQILFTLGSLLCALAPTVQWLIAFRVCQAVGGAMLNPVSNAIVRATFHDSRERARAFGIMGATMGISMALGPVIGGILVDLASWQAIFLINLPVGVVAVILTSLFVPNSSAPRARRFDPIGQILVIVALASLTAAIIEGGAVGYGTSWVVALLAGSGVCFLALVFVELRRHEPLIEMRFFTCVPFSGAIMIAISLQVVIGGFLFVNTLYLQQSRELTPLYAALYMLPMAVTMAVFAPVSGWLASRFGSRPSITAGGMAVTAGGLMLTALTQSTPLTYLFTAYVLLGLGTSLIMPPITNASVTLMPAAQAGVAAAVTTTSRQFGLTLGVALFGVIAGASAGSNAESLAAATHPVWWIVAVIGVMIVTIDWLTTMPWAMRTTKLMADIANTPAPRRLLS